MTTRIATTITLANRQRRDPVPVVWLSRVARTAVRRLNARFTGHRGLTDVLSFRFDGEPVIGEIIVAPAAARRYARAHDVSYREELARYVVHGLLHWTGEEDRTAAQQRRMRRLEDRVLKF